MCMYRGRIHRSGNIDDTNMTRRSITKFRVHWLSGIGMVTGNTGLGIFTWLQREYRRLA